MSIFSFITSSIVPVTDLLGKVVTKEEDILKVKAAMAKLENEIASKVLDYETKLLEAQSKVIVADAQGESWIQRCWRPIMYFTFGILVVADTFGLTAERLSPKAWTLLTIGLGGGILGRTFDKNVPHITKNNNAIFRNKGL